jgi:hypothetical protein
VLDRLLLGETNKEIAAVIGCSPRTVEFHLAQIFIKTSVEGRGRLMSGIMTGLVKTDPPPAPTVRPRAATENDLTAVMSGAARSKSQRELSGRKSRS